MKAGHEIVRVAHPLVGRTVRVARIEQVTPGMRRIHFESSELAGFRSLGPDDHIALFVPSQCGEEHKRHYTPRLVDVERLTLAIDFALHDAGPGTKWAENARVGDELEIGGPKSSRVVKDDFDWYLLVGDETALPAIARHVEGLRAGVNVRTVVAIRNAGEEQTFVTKAHWQASWVRRGDPSALDGTRLLETVAALAPLAGDGYIWMGGEASIARRLYAYFLEREHPSAWLHAAAYWKRGVPDVHEVLE